MRQRYTLTLLLLSIILINVAGCELIWNCGNKSELKRDITELFKKHGVAIKDPVCNMIEITRGATCEFRASADQIASLIRGFNLKEIEGASKDNLLSKLPHAKNGCLECRSLKNVSRMRVYISAHRPPELRLQSGSAFDYLILFQDLDTDKVCVQVSYAYG